MSDLLLRASACPGILDGWVGPVVLDGETLAVLLPGKPHRVYLPEPHRCLEGQEEARALPRHLSLDLARDEAADRCARWLAWAVGLAVGATAPEWERTPRWRHLGEWSLGGYRFGHRSGNQRAPALAALDPADDTRLPCGARRVDRLALRVVAEHVGAGLGGAP